MKLLDKLKDLFMDEIAEEEDVLLEEEENNEYREPPKDVLPKVMRETIKEEEKFELKIKPEELIKREEVQVKRSEKAIEKPQEPVKKFSFPLDFEDDLPSRNNRTSSVNVLKVEKEKEKEKEAPKKVSELYAKKEETWVKPKFKATPVISPVYGVLDKNYRKEEVKEKSEDTVEMKRPSKKVDFETVRKKAFGNLADEIKDNLMCENCELYKEVKKISALKEDDLLYEMTIDDEKDVTIEKAYDNYEEFGVAYENKATKEIKEELEEIKEEIEDKKEEIIEDIVREVKEVVKEEVEEKIPSREEKKKETKVDADFFELIDSMYKERTDD